MKAPLYNQEGKEIDTITLPEEVFAVEPSPDLIHRVAVSHMSNKRQGTAKTKTREEVRGGGRKPWRQKGTGRARHGSIRSPIWKGGGVVFGPSPEKIYAKKVTRKMKRKALAMVLSAKAKENLIYFLDDLKFEPKTKNVYRILQNLFLQKGSGVVVFPQYDKMAVRACRNIAKVAPIQAKDLNVLDLLSYKYIAMPKDSIQVIKDTFFQ